MIKKDSYEVPAIFRMMAREGQVEEKIMYNTYNMGAHQGKSVGVHAGARHADQHISFFEICPRNNVLLIHHAHGKA